MNIASYINSAPCSTGNAVYSFQSPLPNPVGSLHSTVKTLLMAVIAFTVTLGLFWAMSLVIAQRSDTPVDSGPVVVIDPFFQEREIQTIEPESLPPKQKIIEPPKMPNRDMEPDDAIDNTGFGHEFNVVPAEINTNPDTTLTMTGGDARPIVRISPQYPVHAARDGIEGWVQLSFSINELGGVQDIVVVNAEPKRIFNRNAVRALKKWKYRPKMVDGQPVKQVNMTVQLDFKLEGNAAQ